MARFNRSKLQVKGRKTTMSAVVSHREFQRGIDDVVAGRPFTHSDPDAQWQYERGRAFAVACSRDGRAIPPARIGRTVNRSRIKLYHDYRASGDLL